MQFWLKWHLQAYVLTSYYCSVVQRVWIFWHYRNTKLQSEESRMNLREQKKTTTTNFEIGLSLYWFVRQKWKIKRKHTKWVKSLVLQRQTQGALPFLFCFSSRDFSHRLALLPIQHSSCQKEPTSVNKLGPTATTRATDTHDQCCHSYLEKVTWLLITPLKCNSDTLLITCF